MKEIPLTQGKVALVSDEDVAVITQHPWCAWWSGRRWYAQCRINQKVVYMHRFILDAPTGLEVDHIDKDGLNNQRDNLRIASRIQNSWNNGPNSKNKSGFKGVSFRKETKKWVAHIIVNGKQIYLGGFDNKVDAAKAHDKAARELEGEFAYLNFPEQK